MEQIIEYEDGSIEIKFHSNRRVIFNNPMVSIPTTPTPQTQRRETLFEGVSRLPTWINQLTYHLEIYDKKPTSPTISTMGYASSNPRFSNVMRIEVSKIDTDKQTS